MTLCGHSWFDRVLNGFFRFFGVKKYNQEIGSSINQPTKSVRNLIRNCNLRPVFFALIRWVECTVAANFFCFILSLEHLKFWILPVLVSQLEVYYKVDRLPTGLTAQQIGTTARWYLNKTPLLHTQLQTWSYSFYNIYCQAHSLTFSLYLWEREMTL